MMMMHKRQYSDNTATVKLSTCVHCGCSCKGKSITDSSHALDLQHEIEELHSRLMRSQSHMSNMEHEYENQIQVANYDLLKLREEFVRLRDRYERLMESHKRMQKINDNLENKLLNMVNSTESEKTALQKEVAEMTSRLVEAKTLVCELEEENERYRSDCNMAVHLLQCKPNSFVAQKLQTLPIDLQERVKSHMTSEQIINMENGSPEMTKLIHVPMQTFPPTAMVYSVPKQVKDAPAKSTDTQNVPTSLMAKVLTQPEIKRRRQRTYFCVKCKEDYVYAHKETQTNALITLDAEKGVRAAIKVHRKVCHQSLSNSSLENELYE
ncbi:tight junction-associated protein 1-like isoform X2 [Mya arenaria]|uniref:tight junction-associated protein 1-like isoform X2 n=1 Tax=Mya arenaria TaxID=6604 RepID=UPI0022E26A23|nr:tight junction-associated protein 1-like isoform X2 [Mya arenaria]